MQLLLFSTPPPNFPSAAAHQAPASEAQGLQASPTPSLPPRGQPASIPRDVFDGHIQVPFLSGLLCSLKTSATPFCFFKEGSFAVRKSCLPRAIAQPDGLPKASHPDSRVRAAGLCLRSSRRERAGPCASRHFQARILLFYFSFIEAGPGLLLSGSAGEHSPPLLFTLKIKARRGVQWTRTILLCVFTVVLQPRFPDAKSQGCALRKQTAPAPGRRRAPVGCALTL